MKKLQTAISILIVFCMIFGLVGCKRNAEPTETSSTGVESEYTNETTDKRTV